MEALKVSEHVDNWNDDRLDELSKRVDSGFAKVDARFEKVEGQMKVGFAKVDARFEKVDGEMKAGFAKADQKMEKGFAELRSDFSALNRTLIASALGIVGTLIAGVIALVLTHAA
jgi:hypothetical protein